MNQIINLDETKGLEPPTFVMMALQAPASALGQTVQLAISPWTQCRGRQPLITQVLRIGVGRYHNPRKVAYEGCKCDV